MTTVTIEAIEAEHQRIGQLIEQFKAQAATAVYHFPEALITLAPGEHYAGLVIGKDGEPSYHLVLLPGQANDVTWETAMEWASNQCGEHNTSLPTRREQALLYANLNEEFEDRAYWSCEAHESESGWTWFQYFGHGRQSHRSRYFELRARAVRRVYVKTNVGSSDEKGGAARCQSCLGTGKCAKAAILPEPPDVQCPTCRGTGKGGAA